MVVDPWGHVVAKVSDGIGWATARIDPAAHRPGAPRHAGAGTPEAALDATPVDRSRPIAAGRGGFLAGQITFVAAPTALATEAARGWSPATATARSTQAAVIVALGGDGFMLETLHRVLRPRRSRSTA